MFKDRDAVERSHISREAHNMFERDATRFGDRAAVDHLNRAFSDATFGRGPLVGKTGDPFKDDPFFNPWAPGGEFNP